MRKMFFTIALAAATLSVLAQPKSGKTAREEIASNVFLSGSNYVDYNRQLSDETLTPAPKGYEPFYLSHYGRHGSRWLIGENDYKQPLQTFRTAHHYGKLTAKGEEVLAKMEAFYPTTVQRLGELTTVGERQHHGIGQRMAEHFPEIFKTKNLTVDARSTVVIRCILSMEAECEELMAANPTIRLHNDVSESLQYYLNQPWPKLLGETRKKGQRVAEEYSLKFTHPQRLMRELFNDEAWVHDNIQSGHLMRQLFHLACNMQSHDTDIEFYSLFTQEEIYDLWRASNIGWYLDYGPAPQTDGIMPFSQANLLRNIIETADTIVPPYPSTSVAPTQGVQATLRFGHEVCVMPLACLLELNTCGAAVENLDELDAVWRNYRIFPMGCNIQLVFYRPKKGAKGDILVKALLNEREATMPVKTDQWPYYRWADLRQYYLDKLEKFESRLTAHTSSLTKKEPVKMILDTDFGSSTDDLFALMMLNHYMDDGLVDLKGIVVDREGEKNAALVDIFNTYYGHPDIPIGQERNGVKNPRCFIPYNGICDLKDAEGQPLFKRTQDVSRCPEGYKLYRKLLSQAEDKSIVVVAIGFVTTLAQLFESGADEYSPLNGADLFGQKVKAVYIQSGRFEAGDSLSGYNMRAASRQSAVFYDRFPRNVDLIMSPSNVGDQIDYLPQEVLSDLSSTEVNPIKSVYTRYTCDTGQRMWDTNCLVQAVLGDAEYPLSPRGKVTFVDRGEESLMLFQADPQGNARYQLPTDSYTAEQKLMDIRRHTRMNHYPARYTIEAPQPQLKGSEAAEWVRPRMALLVDKYMGSAGNRLDPDDVRMLFRPIGYSGPNVADYREAQNLLVDSIYNAMLLKAINLGKRDVVIVTGPPASGKTTAVNQMNLRKAGLIYDATLTNGNQLEQAVAQAIAAGMEKVTVVMVYNDVVTCHKNDMERGRNIWRYAALDYLVESFRDNAGLLQQLRTAYPDVEIIPVSFAGNQPMRRVSMEEALHWNFDVSDSEFHQMLSYLMDQLDAGNIEPILAPLAAGDLLSIPGLNDENRSLAREIDRKINGLIKENRIR